MAEGAYSPRVMSYNNYGNYSPYFPSQPADPNDRSQYSYQNAPGGTSNNPPHGEYQRQAYVAPNAALSSQQSQPHQNSNGAYVDTMRYSNLEGTASTSHQNQRNDYAYGNARPPGDTTALGNLAYASTLRQTSAPNQRPADYSRQGQNGGYDQVQNQVDGNGIQRSDSRGSRGSSNMNSPYTSAQSYSTYPATSGQQNQGFSLHNSNYRSYQPAYQHPQPTRQEASDARRASQHTVPAPPSRPASGQSTHAIRPQSNQQSNQRSGTAGRTPVQPSSGSEPTQAVNWNSNQPSASSDEAQLSRQLNTQQARPGAVTTAPPNRASVNSTSHIRAPSNVSTHERPASRPPKSAQLPPIQNVRTTPSEPRTDAVEHQHPTTVDPSQVFNHYEYEKRQAEAEASKRKAAAEVEEAKRKAQAAKQTQQTLIPNANTNGVSVNGIDEEARKKEQMETEMKLMLEKMREYKSKDPTLFSQIWESVKKAQPPGTKDTTQASELPASKEVALPSPQVAPSNLQGPKTLQSPSTPAGPPNESETLQAPQNEDIPDRGKFPAARRKRYEKRSRGGRVSDVNEQADEQADVEPRNATNSVTHIPNVASDISKAVASNATTSNSTSHPETDHTPDHATSSTQPAQQVWVSPKKTGIRKARSTPSKKHRISEGAMSSSTLSVAAPSHKPPPTPASDVPTSTLPTASGQTVWPEADKWTLANAARDTLLANPRNEGKLITNTEIHNILNQGPTYEELCRILEAKGFVVDRTPFAKELLAAVPQLKASHPRKPVQATSPPHPPPSQSFQPLQSSQTPQPSQPTQAATNGPLRYVAPTAPMFGVLQPVLRATPTQASEAPHRTPKGEVRPVMQRPVKPPTPPSKQQQARKRTFGEIVDLTAEMSSDEEMKRRRAEELKKIEEIKHMQQVKAAMEAAMITKANANAPNDSTWRSKAIRLSPGTGLSASEDDVASRLSRFKNHPDPPQREKLRRSKEVIRPMNARADALRRSAYDPKTIARDVLVAAGIHPTMASLNYHLDSLRSSFRHVEANSDLSTFKWDLIDPGGPPVKPRKVEIPVAQQNENEDADDEEVDGATTTARRSEPTQNRLSRLAVTNLDDNAEEVIMLDAAPSGPIKGLFQPGRGRGRGRGRGPRPSRGGQSRASFGRPPRQPAHTQAQTPHNSADVSMLGPGVTTTGAFEPRVIPSTPTQTSMTPTTVQLSTGESGKKRRGRPPKYRILGTSEPSPQQADPESAVVHESTSQTVPAGMAQPLDTPRIVGPANSQRPKINTTPARPSGLRNQINTSPFAVVIQRSPNNVESAPSRKAKKPKVSPAPPPKYQVYKCRWKKCEGQLHNLETLRKHVHSHKSQFDDDFECLWEGCDVTKVAEPSDSERQSLTFKSETSWERHMDGRHVDRYAWELGDGPSPHPSGESLNAGREDVR